MLKTDALKGFGGHVQHIAERLLAELSDTPRWIETRAMLRSPHVGVTGGPTISDGVVVRLAHGAMSVVSVVGCPRGGTVVAALEDTTSMTPVITQQDNADHVQRALPDWRRERAVLHRLSQFPELPPNDPTVAIRMLRPDESLEHVPSSLRHELTHARNMAPMAAAVIDSLPVSFCYPCFVTESLWEVSIDTLEAYRRRGLAARVVGCMIAHMRGEGREPIWGALESNEPSLRLAARLGFSAVDETIVFSRGPWAYLTRGYNG